MTLILIRWLSLSIRCGGLVYLSQQFHGLPFNNLGFQFETTNKKIPTI